MQLKKPTPSAATIRLLCLVVMLVGLSASPLAAQAEAGPIELPPWITSDSAKRTVSLALDVTGEPSGSPASIAGFTSGRVRIVVPLGWQVKWHWVNGDSLSNHSLVVMVEREKIPAEGGQPAFTNAMTRMVRGGLKPGQTDDTVFEADQAGWYWMLCGVPGHALGGEWISLQVSREAGGAQVRQ